MLLDRFEEAASECLEEGPFNPRQWLYVADVAHEESIRAQTISNTISTWFEFIAPKATRAFESEVLPGNHEFDAQELPIYLGKWTTLACLHCIKLATANLNLVCSSDLPRRTEAFRRWVQSWDKRVYAVMRFGLGIDEILSQEYGRSFYSLSPTFHYTSNLANRNLWFGSDCLNLALCYAANGNIEKCRDTVAKAMSYLPQDPQPSPVPIEVRINRMFCSVKESVKELSK